MTDINTKCTETNLGPDLAVGAHTFTPADGGVGGGGGDGAKMASIFQHTSSEGYERLLSMRMTLLQAHLDMTTKSIYSGIQQKL